MNAFLMRKIIFPLYHNLKNTRLFEKVVEVEENQWKSHEELILLQKQKLNRMLTHAFEKVPFYRQRFKAAGLDAADLNTPGAFQQIPPLTKKDINGNREQMVSTEVDRRQLIGNSTSGSTGEALYFYTDMNSWVYQRASGFRNDRWLGIELGDRRASLWGAPMDLGKAKALRGRAHACMTNSLLLSSYDLSPDSMKKHVDKLNSFRPALLTSYPGPLAVFAEYLINTKRITPSIKAIICSAETLFPWQRQVIEEAFSCPVYNRYGCREVGDIAQECPHKDGLHLSIDRLFIEIVDDDPNSVPHAGKSGEILITDLENFGMPLIRYRIGDYGSFGDIPCGCGRGLPLLKEIEGRVLDVITAPNGNRLGGTFWTLLFRSAPGIASFQVVQEKIEEITVKYVRDKVARDVPFPLFLDRISAKCGADLRVRFERVDGIPLTSSGKTRFVVSKLSSNDELDKDDRDSKDS
jgi:phenylacetate-CoA ligase